jgi:hypothetical protein
MLYHDSAELNAAAPSHKPVTEAVPDPTRDATSDVEEEE